MTVRACLLIPIYNHGGSIGRTVERLLPHGLPIFIVDDGSEAATQRVLEDLAHAHPAQLHVNRLPVNQGKGAAVMHGMRLAQAAGHTHALQIDADGQHDTGDVPHFLESARREPDAIICGRPVFDDSVPKGRLYGRYITHVWVWIETLSFAIGDSMCGFRMYPLAATCALINRDRIRTRMDFDIEIIVRLAWMGIPIRNLPTRVTYPVDGVSHFRMWRDNWRISCTHTRLVFGMLWRLPLLLRRAAGIGRPTHWAQMAERGSLLGMRVLMVCQGLLGERVTAALLHPIVAYFFLTAPRARKASQDFLSRVASKNASQPPRWSDSYRHMYAFARSGLDKLIAWRGGIASDRVEFSDRTALDALIASGRGALLIGSHLGNLELMRAFATRERHLTVNAVVYTEHAVRFNALLASANDGFTLNLLQVSHFGPDTAIQLKEKIERGEWLVIVGDRTPPIDNGRVVNAEFLGAPAPFAQGPMVLASLLECPVYLLFCVRQGRNFRVDVEPFAERIMLPRAQRQFVLNDWVQRYARRLEAHALLTPLQWFNFYNFWQPRATDSES
jgi:predicted LPLAT superfamily acyltransferase/GT2 family glycosyltransferase